MASDHRSDQRPMNNSWYVGLAIHNLFSVSLLRVEPPPETMHERDGFFGFFFGWHLRRFVADGKNAKMVATRLEQLNNSTTARHCYRARQVSSRPRTHSIT